MKKLWFAILLVMMVATPCFGEEAWYEDAEASAGDYGVGVTKNIPSGETHLQEPVNATKELFEQTTEASVVIAPLPHGQALVKSVKGDNPDANPAIPTD